jgi:hypothetical protein
MAFNSDDWSPRASLQAIAVMAEACCSVKVNLDISFILSVLLELLLQPDTITNAVSAAMIVFNFIIFCFYCNAKITVISQIIVSHLARKVSLNEEN